MTTEILGSVTYSETPTVNGAPVLLNTTSSGTVLQTLATAVPASTGTTQVTLNNTAPTIAIGTQVWSQIITPTSASSRILLSGGLLVSHGTAARSVIVMVFRGTTCIGVQVQYNATASTFNNVCLSMLDSPATTAATTYTIRVAGSGSGSWYVSQTSAAYFAGLLVSNDIITQELA